MKIARVYSVIKPRVRTAPDGSVYTPKCSKVLCAVLDENNEEWYPIIGLAGEKESFAIEDALTLGKKDVLVFVTGSKTPDGKILNFVELFPQR